MSIPALEALERLRAGNRRFIEGVRSRDETTSPARRADLVEGQSPFAVILGCSDSRVPAELVFDQGIGDLFVVRVAGNIVTPPLLGSVEFAIEQLGARLVVVLGHARCGAVGATLDAIRAGARPASPNLAALVEHIRPGVEPVLDDAPDDRETLVARAVRANVRASVEQLRTGSAVLRRFVDDGLIISGAEYSLETGEVQFSTVA